MRFRALQFDDRADLRGNAGTEAAEDGIGRLAADRLVLFQRPRRAAVDGAAIAERVAEHFCEEIPLKLRFLKLVKLALGLQVRPPDEDAVRPLGILFVTRIGRGRHQELWQDEPIGLPLARCERVVVFKECVVHFGTLRVTCLQGRDCCRHRRGTGQEWSGVSRFSYCSA